MGFQNFNAKKFQAKMDTQVNGGKGKGRGSMKAKKLCAYFTNGWSRLRLDN